MPLPRHRHEFVVRPRAEIELLEAAMFYTEYLAEQDWRSDPIHDGNPKSSSSVRDASVLGQPEELEESDGRNKCIAAVKKVQADRSECRTIPRRLCARAIVGGFLEIYSCAGS